MKKYLNTETNLKKKKKIKIYSYKNKIHKWIFSFNLFIQCSYAYLF